MELEPEEQALVDAYRRAGTGRAWVAILILGAILCVAAILMLILSSDRLNALLGLMAGLVVLARALDDRKRALLGRIVRKYDDVLGDAAP